MKRAQTGRFVKTTTGDETVSAYVPPPLPPDPPVDMARFYPLLDQALAALGRLDGMRTILPDANLFLYMYVRKEAVLSSQIEGTQSSLSDLLLHEHARAPGVPFDDVQETSNYVAALNHGLERLDTLPLSLRLIREIHGVLLKDGRGADQTPGEFRRSQNWIDGERPGNARFVPPPPEELMPALDAFEKFLHDDTVRLPVLVKAALAHVQFESIHPFLDGNGRVGRLLITLMLCASGLMKAPLLYLSLYFKQHRQAYYDHLQRVRKTGDWEAWIEFFLNGVMEVADQATDTAREILGLFEEDRQRIEALETTAPSALLIFRRFQKTPLTTTTALQKETGLSLPTILRQLNAMETAGVLREITGKDRHRIYTYPAYMKCLGRGTEPLNRGRS